MMRRQDETFDLNKIELHLNGCPVEGSGRKGEVVRILYDNGKSPGGKVSITLYGTAPSIPKIMGWASQELAGLNMLFHGMVQRSGGADIILKYGTFLTYPSAHGTAPTTFTFSFEIIGEVI